MTTRTEEMIMEGGFEMEESETFTDSFNELSVPDGDWSSRMKVFTITRGQEAPFNII
jgi:hypothetical protein